MIALLLAAALQCGANATQMELDECSGNAAQQAQSREAIAYLVAERRANANIHLLHSEVLWLDARSSACDFDRSLVEGGSIAPMVTNDCYAAASTSRVRDIGLFTGKANPRAMIPSTHSAAEHERIYGLLELLVTPQQRRLLATSEQFFLWYRDEACSHAKDGCATALTLTRTQQLKDSWMAGPFW